MIDVQPAPGIPGARWVDLSQVDGPIDGLGKEEKLLLVCTRGKRGYFLQNRLKFFGYTNTRVLEGGVTFNTVRGAAPGGAGAAAGGDPPGQGAGLPGGQALWRPVQRPRHHPQRQAERRGAAGRWPRRPSSSVRAR